MTTNDTDLRSVPAAARQWIRVSCYLSLVWLGIAVAGRLSVVARSSQSSRSYSGEQLAGLIALSFVGALMYTIVVRTMPKPIAQYIAGFLATAPSYMFAAIISINGAFQASLKTQLGIIGAAVFALVWGTVNWFSDRKFQRARRLWD